MGAQSDDLAPGEIDSVLGRVRELTEGAIMRLPADDLRARVAWCHRTGEHGASVHREGDRVAVWWGGAVLVEIDRATLAALVPDGPEEAS